MVNSGNNFYKGIDTSLYDIKEYHYDKPYDKTFYACVPKDFSGSSADIVTFAGGTFSQSEHSGELKNYANMYPDKIVVFYAADSDLHSSDDSGYKAYTDNMVQTIEQICTDNNIDSINIDFYAWSGGTEECVQCTAALLSDTNLNIDGFTANYAGIAADYFDCRPGANGRTADLKVLADAGIKVNLINNAHDNPNQGGLTMGANMNSPQVRRLIEAGIDVTAISVTWDNEDSIENRHYESCKEIFRELLPYVNGNADGYETVTDKNGRVGLKKDGVTFWFDTASIDENGKIVWTNETDFEKLIRGQFTKIYDFNKYSYLKDSELTTSTNEYVNSGVQAIQGIIKGSALYGTAFSSYASSTATPNNEASAAAKLLNSIGDMYTSLNKDLATIAKVGDLYENLDVSFEQKAEEELPNNINVDSNSGGGTTPIVPPASGGGGGGGGGGQAPTNPPADDGSNNPDEPVGDEEPSEIPDEIVEGTELIYDNNGSIIKVTHDGKNITGLEHVYSFDSEIECQEAVELLQSEYSSYPDFESITTDGTNVYIHFNTSYYSELSVKELMEAFSNLSLLSQK